MFSADRFELLVVGISSSSLVCGCSDSPADFGIFDASFSVIQKNLIDANEVHADLCLKRIN